MTGRAKTNTFASQLRHFARAVDIVDDRIFDSVRGLVYGYVKNGLGAEYLELLRDQPIDGEPGLKMFWSSDDLNHLWRVRGSGKTYFNAVTQAFSEDQPLWIVGRDRQPLRTAETLEDLWSGAAPQAPYKPSVDRPIKTAVAVPLPAKKALGIYFFESCTYLGITEVAKSELLMLASALSILLELYEVNRTQARMTESAIFELQGSLDAAKFPRLAKPHCFIASSSRADPSVTVVIHEVLQNFADQLEFTDWRRMTESGNIATQISREITQSRFGICYLSEPAPVGTGTRVTYVDNPNVVFEAGMLHATTAANEPGQGGEPTGWIPIRESNSPPAPFDFATERTLEVPRFGDGRVNEDRLRQMLTERVQTLLEER
jgi:hypothetical protein